MQLISSTVDDIANFTTDQKARKEAISLIDGIISDLKASNEVWQDYTGNPGAPGDPSSFVSWTGPVRAKQLHEINLDARSKVLTLADIAEKSAGAGLYDDPIEMAYRKLNENESGTDAAKASIALHDERIKLLEALIAKIKNTKPKKKELGATNKPKTKTNKKKVVKRKANKKQGKKKTVKKKGKKKAKKKTNKKVSRKKAKKKVKTKSGKKKISKKKTKSKKSANKKVMKKKAKKKTKKKAGKKSRRK